MLFTAPQFLFVFLPVVYFGFLAISRSGARTAVVIWLLGASMAFYAYWSPLFLALLFVSMTINYAAGGAIERARGRLRKLLAAAIIVFNVLVLAYFKYFNFFLVLASDAGLIQTIVVAIVLPLGISFFTFQKIAYIADIYQGKAKSSGFLDFALFVFFFPQLIAGPIVHHAEIMPQFQKFGRLGSHVEEFWENAGVGATLIVIGLFKKVVVADQIAVHAASAFAAAQDADSMAALLAWQGALCYTVQLYFDFSGYSDMAIGLARLFGVTFPANFDSPYRATSIIDFWRRWHMTLSRFLRDYIYIPLGGNRVGPARRYLNLFVTMVIGGFWHGAGWTFIFWGALHGTYLLINHAWRRFSRVKIPAPLGYGATMIAVIVAWVFFRSPNMSSAFKILAGMSFANGVYQPEHSTMEAPGAVCFALALLGACVVLPNSQQLLIGFAPILGRVRPRVRWQWPIQWRPNAAWAVVFAIVAAAVVLLSWQNSEFLYFNF